MKYPGDFIDKVICGSSPEEMSELPDNSIHACVTDPPYELGFMGKAWDKQGIAYNMDLWREVLRVLKPGGHLLAFGGSRTYHRMACAVEDAGFEIRDQIQWVYGAGFPKSLDISKAIDADACREQLTQELGRRPTRDEFKQAWKEFRKVASKSNRHGGGTSERYMGMTADISHGITAPTTPEAREWSGWGTALKPAHEPIVVARKPLSEKTVAANVLKWGTGGLNIDACRVETNGDTVNARKNKGQFSNAKGVTWGASGGGKWDGSLGRFPANFIHDGSDEVVELMPMTTKGWGQATKGNANGKGSMFNQGGINPNRYDMGGQSAARFFYCAKASKKERDMGLNGMKEIVKGSNFGNNGARPHTKPDYKYEGKIKNHHPTVKPIALMQYLIKLVTREGQIVIDPFAGSGSTLIACKQLNRHFIGIEISPDYCKIARERLMGVPDSLFKNHSPKP